MLGRRGTPNHRAAESLLRGAGQLRNSVERIVERDHRDSRQPARTMRAIVGQPIVVGAETRCAQLAVLYLKETHREARVQDLAADAVAILILDARDWIPRARPDPGIAARHPLREIFRIDARDCEACDRERAESFGDEEIALTLAGTLD